MAEIDSAATRLDKLVLEYLNAKNSLEKWEKRIEDLEETLIRELGVGGRHQIGTDGEGVRIQAPVRMFKAEKAREALTEQQYASICELKPTSAKATEMLPGVLVDQCKAAVGAPSVHPLKKRPRD